MRLKIRKTKKTPRSMAMPTASMREYAFGLVKASFHRPHHFLSALSQAIPPCFERKTSPAPSSFCRRTKCRGEDYLLEIPCCSAGWLALPFWGGMGEALVFFLYATITVWEKVMFRRKQRKIQPHFSSKEYTEHKKVINLLLINLLLIKLLLAKKKEYLVVFIQI